jgi:hypothetical protein
VPRPILTNVLLGLISRRSIREYRGRGRDDRRIIRDSETGRDGIAARPWRLLVLASLIIGLILAYLRRAVPIEGRKRRCRQSPAAQQT